MTQPTTTLSDFRAASSRRSATILALVAAAILIVLALNIVLTLRNTQQLQEDASLVTHTHDVISDLEGILSLAKDAETGQRGYIITNDAAYMGPYKTAIKEINSEVDAVERLTHDNPRQQARFPELRKRLSERLSILDESIELMRAKGFDDARQIILSGRGKSEMDALREVVKEMVEDEQALLRDRSEASARAYRVAVSTGLLTGFTALGSVAGFLVLLRRHLVARARDAFVIAEQAERLRTTLASIGDAVIATDGEGRITTMNAVAEELTGWSVADALGQPLEVPFRIVNEETRKTVESPVSRALREGVIVGLANHTILISKNGREWPIDDSAAPIRCAEGEIVGCVLVFRDITERKHSEMELRQLAADLSEADRRKDEFLATLAHELRNPLAPVRNAVQLLRLKGPDSPELRWGREVIERQVGHLTRLIDDLLDISRITRNKLELRKERVELSDVIQGAVETSRPIIEQCGHELIVKLPSRPVYLDADLVRLAQVFMNLLTNAAKYTEEQGKIWLTAERQNGEVIVSVKDTGVGIPVDKLPRLFELFFQVDRSLERSQGGLGIGLSLVRRLVELHGGKVEAHSDGPKKGSEFIVRMPVLPDNAPQYGESKADEDAQRQSAPKRRVVLVDDHVDSALSLAMLLRFDGHDVQVANDGLAGYGLAEKTRPEVVLLDIGMPKMNGFEVCRRIRQQDWGKDVVLIALTGWGQDEDRRTTEGVGFNAHLVKPVDYSELKRLLRETSGTPAT